MAHAVHGVLAAPAARDVRIGPPAEQADRGLGYPPPVGLTGRSNAPTRLTGWSSRTASSTSSGLVWLANVFAYGATSRAWSTFRRGKRVGRPGR